MILIQILVVAALALVHLFAGKLRFLEGIPRSRWLSMAGGVAVNVLKEELPAERQSRFLPFALGAAFFAALLLAA